MGSYDDDDDDDYTPSVKKMKMPSVMGLLSCTPLKIYLSVALISMIVYYGDNLMKGKVDFGNCCWLMSAILCSSMIVVVTCKTNFVVSWILALVFSVCAMYFAMGKITIPTKLF